MGNKKNDDEIRRVHDVVRTSLGAAHWIVAAAAKQEIDSDEEDSERKPPSSLVVRGLIETVSSSDPGEQPDVTKQFIGVADTSEDIGLPDGLPATSWHFAAGQIVARVFSSIVNPKGHASQIAGVRRSNGEIEIDTTKLDEWWP